MFLISSRQTDFAVTTDSNGELFVYNTRDEQTKNHQSDSHKNEGRMWEVKGLYDCILHRN